MTSLRVGRRNRNHHCRSAPRKQTQGEGSQTVHLPGHGQSWGATAAGQKKPSCSHGYYSTGLWAFRFRSTWTRSTWAGGKRITFGLTPICSADGIVLVNRIKPHASFRGKYESGLIKMIAIGLASRRARAWSSAGHRSDPDNIVPVGRQGTFNGKILFGIGLVEKRLS